MAENITSFYDLYNRANDAGKATDIQSDDLFIMQRGTGSNRNKCIKGSDMKLSSALVIAAAGDTVPGHLINKLDNSGDIAFDDFNAASGKKIKAELKTNVVDADNLKSNSVTTSKIAEGAVTESKIALNSIQEQAIKDSAVTASKLGDGSVSTDKLQNNSVTGAKLGLSVIDAQHTGVMVTLEDIVDQATAKCDVTVHQFSAVGTGGVVDVTVHADYLQGDDYMTDVSFEIRKSGSSTAESTFEVGTPSTASIVSRRMVVKNGLSAAVNYELHMMCKANFDPGGVPVSGFQACDVDIRGISIA